MFLWKTKPEILSLGYKSFILAVCSAFLYIFKFQTWTIILFFLAIFWVFITEEQEERKQFGFSFLLTSALVFLLIKGIADFGNTGNLFIILIFCLIFIVFFVILGLLELFFMNQYFVYDIFSTVLIFLWVFLIQVFIQTNIPWFLLILVLFFVIIFKELNSLLGIKGYKNIIFSIVPAFIMTESAFLAAFLPFNIFNFAILETLIFISLKHSIWSYFIGGINTRNIFINLAIFSIICLLLFLTINWRISFS